MQRDIEVTEHLTDEDWTVLRFWGNDVKMHLDECVEAIMEAIAKDRKA